MVGAISPNTTIHLLSGILLDNTYENTIYFANQADQYAFFTDKIVYTLTEQSYQRVERNTIRVELTMAQVMTVDYLMFKNTSYENKWFYAFISEARYINNNVTEIEYEIDVMQTWFYDCDLFPSFVEREHSRTDNPGDNTIPEKLDIGHDYEIVREQTIDLSDSHAIAIVTAYMPQTGEAWDWLRQDNMKVSNNKVFTGLDVKDLGHVSADLQDFTVIATNIRDLQEDSKNIVGIFQYPTALMPAIAPSWVTDPAATAYTIPNTDAIVRYQPVNKKLLCYPYRCIRVTNNAGVSAIYEYENWTTPNEISFKLDGTCVPSPDIILYPTNYLRSADNYTQGIMLNNTINCAWTSDTFTQWWNTHAAQFTTGAITSALSSITGGLIQGNTAQSLYTNPATAQAVAGGAMTNALINTGVGVANAIAQYQDISNAPDTTKGQTNASTLLHKEHRYGFTIQFLAAEPEYLEICDWYFDLYGYATHTVKIPNINVRPSWCYTKTIGCNIKPKPLTLVGAPEIKKIKEIFNTGIRFWKDGNNVGNYNLHNEVSTTP